jgi:hypothetical protein
MKITNLATFTALFLAPTFEGNEITDVMGGFPVNSQWIPCRVTRPMEIDVVLNDTGMASIYSA